MRDVALKGGRWTAGQAVLVQVLSTLATMILARLLIPEDFGIVAIVTLVLLLFSIVTDVGLGASILRRESVDRNYLSTIFWTSSFIGLVAMTAAAVASPVLATLAGNRDATPYLVVASVTLLFGTVGSVPRSLLLRDFRFKATAASEIGSFALYMAIAIPLAAFTPLGAWAIVLGRVGMSAFRLVVQWSLSGWWPRLHFRFATVREDFTFNIGFLGQRASNYVAKNVDHWFVGAILGTATLGVYYIAYVLPNILRQRLTAAVNRTLFAIGASFANDRMRVQRAYLESMRIVTLASYPVLVGLALVAAEIVPIAFGRQWLDAITPLAILAVAAAVNVILPVGEAVLTVIGMPHRSIVVNLTSAALIGVGVAATIEMGNLGAVAYVVLAATVLSVLLQMTLLRQPLDLSWRLMANSLWPATASVMAMAAAVSATRLVIDSLGGVVFRLLILVTVGAVVYIGFGFVAFHDAFSKARADLGVVLNLRREKQRTTD